MKSRSKLKKVKDDNSDSDATEKAEKKVEMGEYSAKKATLTSLK